MAPDRSRPGGAGAGGPTVRTDLIRPLPGLLRAQAERFGGKAAFDDGERAVTYRDLEERTRRLAGHLARLGLQPGDRAAIAMGDRVELVESYFALVRAGAIGVPVDPSLADDELAGVLADSGARLVLADRAHLDQLSRLPAGCAPTVVLVGSDGPAPAGIPLFEDLAQTHCPTPARDDLALDDLAWMVYTAGTTGRPKGVLSTQRNCLWSVAACYVPVLGLEPEDRVLWPLPLFHSLAQIACILAVTAVGAGARIVGAAPPAQALEICARERCTVIAGVPATYHRLVAAARAGAPPVPDLRVGLVGGAATPARLRRAVESTFGIAFVDAYGSTETSGSITVSRSGRTDGRPGGQDAEPGGLPVPGLALRLVDPAGADVPDGAEGEVWVRGPNVMAGYHNQPEATARVLAGGWYRTGDLARRDPNGFVALTGRIDELIIRAGENIHPAQIEQVIRAVPGVADVAVVGRPHEVLGQVPVALVVPAPAGLDPARLLAACREKLSAAKVPEEFYQIARIPRVAPGKVARHKLAAAAARLLAVGESHYESLYRVDWVPRPVLRRPEPGRWAVVGGPDQGTDPRGLVNALTRAGASVTAYPDLAALRAAAARGEPPFEAAVLAPPRAAAGPAAFERRLAGWPQELERWLADGLTAHCALVATTRGAVSTGPGDPLDTPDQALSWGLLRCLQRRHPDRIRLVDLALDQDAALLPTVLDGRDPLVAVRDGVILRPQPTRVSTDRPHGAAFTLDARDTVVVTGADTARGATVARHLAAGYGVRRLLLVTGPGRALLAAEPQALAAEAGADVRLAACDVADRAALARALAKAPAPVTAAVHTWEAAAGRSAAYGAAVTGARNLRELTGRTGRGALILLSATAGTAGAPSGLEHEASCAAFLDAYAVHLRGQGVAALSLGWEPWEAGAAGLGDEASGERRALAAFDAALTVNTPYLVAARADPGGPA